MKKQDFYFELPEELIAQDPLEDRSGSRLMVLDKKTGEVKHKHFTDIVEYLNPGDCLVINNTKVIPARLIGERMAEEIKMRVGSAFPLDEELTMEVKGRDSVAGLPKSLVITSQEIREALDDTFNQITDAIKETFEHCSGQLSADLVDRGLVLAGGGALIRNLNLRISDVTGLPCFVADDPLRAVANGTGIVLQNLKKKLDDGE